MFSILIDLNALLGNTTNLSNTTKTTTLPLNCTINFASSNCGNCIECGAISIQLDALSNNIRSNIRPTMNQIVSNIDSLNTGITNLNGSTLISTSIASG